MKKKYLSYIIIVLLITYGIVITLNYQNAHKKLQSIQRHLQNSQEKLINTNRELSILTGKSDSLNILLDSSRLRMDTLTNFIKETRRLFNENKSFMDNWGTPAVEWPR